MPESLQVSINGQPRSFNELQSPTELASLIAALELKADRVAVEHNGKIAPRTAWMSLNVQTGDKLEIVHFVGGGTR